MLHRFRCGLYCALVCLFILIGSSAVAGRAEGSRVDKIAFFALNIGTTPGGIFIADPDGKNVQRLIPNDILLERPAWSPDGTQIAYLSSTSAETWNLMVAGADGSNPHVVSSVPSADPTSFAWSPDSKQLIFVSDRPGIDGGPGLYKVNADGSGEQNLKISGVDTTVFIATVYWFPDGQHILFPGTAAGDTTPKILMANADGSNVQPYLSGLAIISAVSPDGQHIAYFDMQNVTVANSDGSNPKPITASMVGPLFTQFVAWSPDSKKVAFTSTTNNASVTGSLYIANADGSGVQQIAVDGSPAISMLGIAWGSIPAALLPRTAPIPAGTAPATLAATPAAIPPASGTPQA